MPMMLFSLIPNITYTFPRGPTAHFHRMMPCLSMLITSAAFKFVIANMTPQTTYLTFLDKYVLWSNLQIILNVCWAGLGHVIEGGEKDCELSEHSTCYLDGYDGSRGETADKIFYGISICGWALTQLFLLAQFLIGTRTIKNVPVRFMTNAALMREKTHVRDSSGKLRRRSHVASDDALKEFRKTANVATFAGRVGSPATASV